MIEIDRKCPRRILRARTCDINVEAKRVVLRATKCTGTMESDYFVAKYIVPCNSSLILISWLMVFILG